MKSFFSKKSILGTMAVAAVCMLGTGNAQAQEFTIQGDLVSSYVWRGIYQGGAASFQPTLGFSVGNFSLTAWGSTSLSESNKEIDLTAAYKFGEAGPTLSVASLWWNGQADVANGELTNDYFHFKSGDTGHHFEAGLAYTLPIEKFPLSIAWYTMFAGADRKTTDEGEEKQAYSSYVELNYPFSVKGVDLNATCGVVPYKTPQYNVNGFAVTNLALKATKAINFNDKFSLPIFVLLYGSAMLGDTGVKGIGEVAYTKSTNDITSSLALMNQDTDATMLSAGVKTQKSFDLGTFEVIPSLGVRVSHIKTDAMKAGNVEIEKQKQTIVQIPLALRVNAKATETASGWSVTPKFKVAFIPTVGDKSIEVFGVKQSVIDTSPVQGSFGVGFAKGNLTIDAAAHLGAGNKGTSAVGGKVGLTYRF